jgi:hypothetical protein
MPRVWLATPEATPGPRDLAVSAGADTLTLGTDRPG